MPTASKQKLEELSRRMERLGILDADLIEKFILSSGKGGQKANKTASCVYLKHLPTGIEIKCGRERSRELNRFFARRELCDRLDHTSQKQAAKIRKQKKRRSRRHLPHSKESGEQAT